MWRYLAGAASALVLIVAGFFLVRSMAGQEVLPPVPETEVSVQPETIELASAIRFAGSSKPPTATELSKEEKRFNRYDKDKNGAVAKSEYLASRRKAYEKLDVNGDGVLSFDEYATKTAKKFVAADKDRSGVLNRSEFSTTRVVRKGKPKPNCPPARAQPAAEDKAEVEETSDS